jgi:predicted TIM-barrel fold metal-dependent hydrolase
VTGRQVEVPATDEDLPDLWASLGLPGVIDVHVHAMPERLQAAVWRYFDNAGPLLGREWPIHYRGDLTERTARLRAAGVLAWTTLLYPHKPGMAAALNEWAAQFARRTPDVIQSATFFAEPSAAADVATAIEAGARVFKAHVQVGGYDPRDPTLDPVWGLLTEANIPVVTHCGNGPVPGAFTGPEIWAQVMARHPRLPVIIAHLGMPDFEAFFDLAEQYPIIRLDTTAVFGEWAAQSWPFPAHGLPRLRALGDRILFGSDFPAIPYPYAEQIAALVELGLGTDWLRAVFHTNAATLWPDLLTAS